MKKIQIITDSSVDLPQEYIDKHDIYVVPFYISFGEKAYRDGVDITTEKLYEKVKNTGIMPKTAAISPAEWKMHFDKFYRDDTDILCITIGSKSSSTFQNAYLMSKEYPKDSVVVVDSKTLSGAQGLLTLKAIKYKALGMTAKEIGDKLDIIKEKMHTQFVIKTLEYLHKGGRCSGLTRLLSAMLSIKPQIKMDDGELKVYKKSPGKFSRAVDTMLDDFFKLAEEDKLDLEYVFITHSIAPKMKDYIEEKLKASNVKIENLIESHAGSVISSHCGEGTIGILYLEK